MAILVCCAGFRSFIRKSALLNLYEVNRCELHRSAKRTIKTLVSL